MSFLSLSSLQLLIFKAYMLYWFFPNSNTIVLNIFPSLFLNYSIYETTNLKENPKSPISICHINDNTQFYQKTCRNRISTYWKVTVMVSVNCQYNRIYNCLGWDLGHARESHYPLSLSEKIHSLWVACLDRI